MSENDHSFAALYATRPCVLNIPTIDLATQVVGCGHPSGARVDMFATFGLTPTAASPVAAPLIADCYPKLECRVVDTRMKNGCNFFVPEVFKPPDRPGVQGPAHAAPLRLRFLHRGARHHRIGVTDAMSQRQR